MKYYVVHHIPRPETKFVDLADDYYFEFYNRVLLRVYGGRLKFYFHIELDKGSEAYQGLSEAIRATVRQRISWDASKWG